MESEYPEFLYKYRSINYAHTFKNDDINNLEKDNTIDALLNNTAIFSSRKNFNDLFDSKIELLWPTPKQVKDLKALVKKHDRDSISKFINKGKFTDHGIDQLKDIEKKFNNLIDSYPFLSLSKTPKSNLMWSHYAGSHTAFCIEFRSKHVKADKVIYKNEIPKLNILELLRLTYQIDDGKEIGQHIWKSLRTKLCEWSYEEEYRFQPGDDMNAHLAPGDNFLKIQYEPKFIESIIFGCRMDSKVKEFIINRMPRETQFKIAREATSTIEIVPYTQPK